MLVEHPTKKNRTYTPSYAPVKQFKRPSETRLRASQLNAPAAVPDRERRAAQVTTVPCIWVAILIVNCEVEGWYVYLEALYQHLHVNGGLDTTYALCTSYFPSSTKSSGGISSTRYISCLRRCLRSSSVIGWGGGVRAILKIKGKFVCPKMRVYE